MKLVQTFSRIALDSGIALGDYPRGYEIYVSNDSVSWGNPVAVGNGYGPVASITFTPITARFIRIYQTGDTSQMGDNSLNWWGISELNVYKK
jgi:hypothetical protein